MNIIVPSNTARASVHTVPYLQTESRTESTCAQATSFDIETEELIDRHP